MTQPRTLSRGLDYLGDIGAKLRDLQGFRTLAHELIQNADDAKTATSISFDIKTNALVVDNDGVFSECTDVETPDCEWKSDRVHNHRCDFHRFRYVASGDKRGEEGTTGAFGIGFIAVYQITDRPELISKKRHWIIHEEQPEDQRINVCPGCSECSKAALPGTRFILPWILDPNSPLRQALRADAVSPESPERMLQELRRCIPIAMLFLKRLRKVTVRKDGRDIKAWHRSDKEDTRIVTDGDHKNDQVWQIIQGEFDEAARRLRNEHYKRIEEKRSSLVTLAIPKAPLKSGVLCAGLPTEHDIGLGFHINADFFPSNDRKRIILDQDYQSEWNREALRAAALAFGNHLDQLPKFLGGLGLWSLISGMKRTAQRAKQHQGDAVLSEFWSQTAPRLGTARVVPTSEGDWVAAADASLLMQKEEAKAIPLLKALGIRIVNEDLRSFYTELQTDAGVALLDIETIANALRLLGLTRRTEKDALPVPLQTANGREILWDEIHRLLDRQERTPKAKAEDQLRLADIAIAPGLDGAFWPCREAYFADGETIELFRSMGLAIPFLDARGAFSRLTYLCRAFDVSAAILFLERAEDAVLEQLWIAKKLSLPRLIAWFENRRQEILGNAELIKEFTALKLFPSAGQLCSFDLLSLPGDFNDPLGLAEILDLAAVGNRREFFRDLGMPDLSFSTYATTKLPAVLAENKVLPEKMRQITVLLAMHLGELKGNEDARGALAALSIVECGDSVFRRPADCHFDTEVVRICLGDTAFFAALPDSHSISVRDFYAWLGVADHPRIGSIVARLRKFAASPYSKTIAHEIQAIVAYLGNNLEDPEELPELQVLRTERWLPARGRLDRWYAGKELYATYQDYLFETQALFVDLPRNIQDASRNLFEFLSIGLTPPASLVVKHLLECAARQKAVNAEVYRFLNEKSEDISIGGLRGEKCLWLTDRYYLPNQVFWGEHPFGRYRKRLGEELRSFSRLLKELDVRDAPGWEDALDVLREIAEEFGPHNTPLDDEAHAVLMACWRTIGEAVEIGTASVETISDLGSVKCVPGPNRVLNPPVWMFFENRANLASKFGNFLTNNVIARPIGAGRALDIAGVRSLGTAVEIDVLECANPVDDAPLKLLLNSRRIEMGRVLDSVHFGIDTARALKRLDLMKCQRAESLKIRYRLKVFNRELLSEEEQVASLYLDDQAILLYTRRNGEIPWAPISREIAAALFPDEDPGRFAAGLKEVLAASSVQEAAAMLDELGFAKLDISGTDTVTVSESVGALGTEGRDDDASPVIPNDPNGQQGQLLTPEDAVKQLLGVDTPPPTPGLPTGESHFGGNGTGTASSANGKKDGSGKTKSSKTRPILRSYLPAPGSSNDTGLENTPANDRSPIDKAGVRRVIEHELNAKRTPKEMPHNHEGYDIESRDGTGQIVRYIEVKSFSGQWRNTFAILSRPQFEMQWKDQDERCWLYVVELANSDDFQIHRIQNPALKANHFMFDDGWRAFAEMDSILEDTEQHGED